RRVPHPFSQQARLCGEGDGRFAGADRPGIPVWLLHAAQHLADRNLPGTAGDRINSPRPATLLEGNALADPAPFKYRAFLSYSHRDKGWGEWLHRALETYAIGKDLIGRATPA